jgi:hypothetical protein
LITLDLGRFEGAILFPTILTEPEDLFGKTLLSFSIIALKPALIEPFSGLSNDSAVAA